VNIYVFGGLALVAAAGSYAVSLARRPWSNCRACKGGGKDKGLIWRYAYTECETCGGAGRRPRAGVRIFQSARARALKWGTQRSARRLP